MSRRLLLNLVVACVMGGAFVYTTEPVVAAVPMACGGLCDPAVCNGNSSQTPAQSCSFLYGSGCAHGACMCANGCDGWVNCTAGSEM